MLTITETRVYTTNEKQERDSYIALGIEGINNGVTVCQIDGPIKAIAGKLGSAIELNGQEWAIRDIIKKAANGTYGLSLVSVNRDSNTAQQRGL